MAKLIEKYTYGFEDVSLKPAAMSDVFSRRDVDTGYWLTPRIYLDTPIIASPMADVCDDRVAIAMQNAGGIGCIHRFQDIKDQAAMVARVRKAECHVLAAVGTDPAIFKDRARAVIDAGAEGIIVDVAFLNRRTLDACSWIKQNYPDIYLISGNVATADGYVEASKAGLNAVRVGIGNGQACRTSRVTGVGIGLVTSLMECFDIMNYSKLQGFKPTPAIICDGGMDTGGSLCKALAAGAHLAIFGRAIAATHEAPGKTYAKTGDFTGGILGPYEGFAACSQEQVDKLIENKCPIFKEYRGSASIEAQITYKQRRDIVTSEGVASLVQVYGSVEDVISRFNGAIRSSMSYLGARNLEEYRNNAVFMLVGEGVFSQTKARALISREITI